MMRLAIAGVMTAGVLAGCATSGGPEMVECLQPDRRVVLEVNGTRVKPAPKPKEGEKPGKPEEIAAELSVNVQGNTAFDPKSAVLKEGGKADIDEFLKDEVKGKQPVKVGAIIITGHSDKLESGRDDTALSEARAKSVMDYMISQGYDQKLMFWEGRGSRQPVPVTKFCS